MCTSDIFLGLLAILFPPIAVWIKVGLCSADSIINILLCMLGYIPGLIHAWYIISLYPEPSDDEYAYAALDPETGGGGGVPPPHQQRNNHGRSGVTYYYVERPSAGRPVLRQEVYPQQQPQPRYYPQQGQQHQHQQSYGTVQGSSSQQQQQQQGSELEGAGGVPPSYEQAVKGDNKVQR